MAHVRVCDIAKCLAPMLTVEPSVNVLRFRRWYIEIRVGIDRVTLTALYRHRLVSPAWHGRGFPDNFRRWLYFAMTYQQPVSMIMNHDEWILKGYAPQIGYDKIFAWYDTAWPAAIINASVWLHEQLKLCIVLNNLHRHYRQKTARFPSFVISVITETISDIQTRCVSLSIV